MYATASDDWPQQATTGIDREENTMAIAEMQTSQDAITKSDKQYLRSLGIKPNEITIFDLFEQMKSMPYPDTTSREAVEQHYAVIKRVLDISRETMLRAVQRQVAE